MIDLKIQNFLSSIVGEPVYLLGYERNLYVTNEGNIKSIVIKSDAIVVDGVSYNPILFLKRFNLLNDSNLDILTKIMMYLSARHQLFVLNKQKVEAERDLLNLLKR